MSPLQLDSALFLGEDVERWANEHKYFEALDRLRQNLDEIARTDFRQA